MKNTKVILCDIEGTTSSISFVKDVLFPYADENLESFVEANKANPEVQRILIEVVNQASLELRTSSLELQNRACSILRQWIKLDLKNKPLKDLQGLIWEAGYKNGDYQGHIYDDAYEHLFSWYKQGIKLYIYSSGSIYAQKLLFGHTKYGDLNYLFSGNFDTSVGNKREPRSYVNIYESISADLPGLEPQGILFLSDVQEEIDAALEACLRAVLITREAGIDFNSLG